MTIRLPYETKQITTRINVETSAKLDEIANTLSKTPWSLMREIIEDFVARFYTDEGKAYIKAKMQKQIDELSKRMEEL